MKKSTAILLTTFLLFSVKTTAGFDFRYLRPYDGLKDSEITSIAQDDDGLMWFATWSGLIKYNGYDFSHYRPELGNPRSLPTKKIKELFVDSRNNLWIATDRHLCLYNREKDNFITLEFERDESVSLNVLHFLELEDRMIIHALDGFYYIMTDPVVNQDSPAPKIEIRSSYPGTNYYFNFSMSNDDKLYFASNNSETNIATMYSGEFSDFDGTPHIFVKELNIASGNVNDAVYVENESSIYLATTEGVKPYSVIKNDYLKESYFKGQDIQNILHAGDNRIYCSAINPALHYIDLHTGNTGTYEGNPYRWGSLLNNTILSLYEGFSGNLWVGHQGQGISILNLQKKEFNTYRHIPYNENSLASNTVMCFEGAEREIFVGCRVGGITVMKKDNEPGMNRFHRIRLYSEGSTGNFEEGIWDIERVTDDYYLAGTLEGVYKVIKEKGEWRMYPFSEESIFGWSTRKIFVDENKNAWFGVAGYGLILVPDIIDNEDLIYYQFTSESDNPQTLSDNEIISMHVDSKSRFWIGTTNGLNLLNTPYNKINLSGNVAPELTFKRFVATRPDPEFLNNNEINCIFENFDNTIWFGTQGGGINIYHPDEDIFSHLTIEDGLPSNDVMGILRDETGVLWMSTKSDLVSYNQYAENPRFVRYSFYDGTQGNIYMVNAFYRYVNGDMFFGGDNGFTTFTPGDIKPNNIAPKLAITDLRIIDREIEVGDTISKNNTLANNINYTEQLTLPFSMKVFSIGVAVLHYQYPEGNYLAYKLEGFDNHWNYIPAEKRYLQFSNLPHGNYTLKLRAYSSDDVPLGDIKQLGLIITPPWYKEWYFILVYVLIGLAIVLSFAWIAYNRQKLAYQKKLDDMSIQTNESKMLFLTNIAHGLRTPLSLVIGPVEDMLQNYTDVNPKWRNHLLLIHRNSNYLLKLINQIIDFRRLHAGKLTLYRQNLDIGKLVKEVGINFKGFEGRRKVRMQFEIPDDPVIISVDSQKIEEVLYNLLSNAFKHTPDEGSIVLSLGKTDVEVRISVFNEGSEIEENEKYRIFERFYKKDENIEGAGIGLSFSKSLVELHGGRIEVESYNGKGVVFHVYLPYEREEAAETTDQELVKSEIIEASSEGWHLSDNGDIDDSNELKVLLVEDNEDLRSFLKSVLSKEYAVYEAGNGKDGLELVKEIMPDIVISDIIMPVMDGYKFCKEIKDSQSICHIPVILLTAKDTNEQMISGYDVGADAYVTKPFDLGVISSQISRLIKNRKLIRKKYLDQNFMIEVTKNNLSRDDEFIINVRKLLESNLANPDYNVKELASSLNISSTQLYRKIKALTGYSPGEFIRLIKLQKAYELLVKRTKSVKEICYLSGFNNVSYFIKCFKDQYGVTPAAVKDNGGVDVDHNSDNTKNSKISKLEH